MQVMHRFFHQLIHCLPSPTGLRLDRQLRPTGRRRAQFISYLESSGYRTRHVDSYERSLRRRRMAKFAFFWLTAFGVAWVVIESARAVTIF